MVGTHLSSRHHSFARARRGRSVALIVSAGLVAGPPSDAGAARQVAMSLAQAVDVAVRNSRALESSRLDRRIRTLSLIVAEDRFRPDLILAAAATNGGGRDARPGDVSHSRRNAVLSDATLRLAVRSGGELSYGGSVVVDDDDSGDGYRLGHALSFRQPLLRGRGRAVATAPVELARIDDRLADIALEATFIDIITATVLTYRDLLRAREEVVIAERSLTSARELMAVNRELVDVGRLPAVELVQSETDIAQRELAQLGAENQAAAAELRLVAVLDADLDVSIVTTESIHAERRELDLDAAIELAFAHSPEYRAALLRLEIDRLSVVLAGDERRWDLDLTATVEQSRDGAFGAGIAATRRDHRIGVEVRRVLGEPGRDVGYESARLGLAQDRLALRELEETIRIDVRDLIRSLELSWRQLELSARARELSERQLEIEREKLNAGRSSSFQVVSFQNGLVDARNAELAATIAYLDALTLFDRTLGTTLRTWNVDPVGESAVPVADADHRPEDRVEAASVVARRRGRGHGPAGPRLEQP